MKLLISVLALFGFGPVAHVPPVQPAITAPAAPVRPPAPKPAPPKRVVAPVAPIPTATTTTAPPTPWCVVGWVSSAPIFNPNEDNDPSGPNPHGYRSMACSDIPAWEAEQPSTYSFTVEADPGPKS